MVRSEANGCCADVAELAYAYGLGPYPLGVESSTLSVRTIFYKGYARKEIHAAVIQLEECLLAKEDVVGSNPIRRSNLEKG